MNEIECRWFFEQTPVRCIAQLLNEEIKTIAPELPIYFLG